MYSGRRHERIELDDSFCEIYEKMSEGNPEARTVLIKIVAEDECENKIDPDNIMGGIGVILYLETLAIYGPRIWMLFKDVCGQSIARMLAVLRSNQLNLLSSESLYHAIDNVGEGIDFDKVLAKLSDRLPNFNINAVK